MGGYLYAYSMDFADVAKSIESKFDLVAEPRAIFAIRVDGKAFHTFTKTFEKPYDLRFMKAMDDAGTALVSSISGVLFAYVQSDEITVFFSDLQTAQTGLWYGGRIQKWVSVAAATASAFLARALPETSLIPTFDARVLRLESMEQVSDYLRWRRRDAFKNAISMAAEVIESHLKLMGLNTSQRIELLSETAYSEDKLPLGFLNGRLVYKENYEAPVPEEAKKFHPEGAMVTRTRFAVAPATREAVEDLLSSIRLG